MYENQRCPWRPFSQPNPDNFSLDSLLRDDHTPWSNAEGTTLPAPSTDRRYDNPLSLNQPPHGRISVESVAATFPQLSAQFS